MENIKVLVRVIRKGRFDQQRNCPSKWQITRGIVRILSRILITRKKFKTSHVWSLITTDASCTNNPTFSKSMPLCWWIRNWEWRKDSLQKLQLNSTRRILRERFRPFPKFQLRYFLRQLFFIPRILYSLYLKIFFSLEKDRRSCRSAGIVSFSLHSDTLLPYVS